LTGYGGPAGRNFGHDFSKRASSLPLYRKILAFYGARRGYCAVTGNSLLFGGVISRHDDQVNRLAIGL
jgi:hypothetical protein